MSTIALAAPRVRRLNWQHVALGGVLVVAALLCLWNLTISGYSNEYYAAATRAGAESWKAWFFGAIDPGSFITVDKPPLSLWLMGLSARAFGYSSFSVLLPQALCGVASVAVLWATVRRLAGPVPALVAAAALALSPIAVAVARVDNPDALLVLLLVLSAYCTVRAIESGHGKWLAWGRRRRRPRLHDQDAPGLDGRARARRGVLARRPAEAARARAAAGRRPRGDGRGELCLAARRHALAGREAVHRWQHRRLRLGPDPRLQRLRPDLRRRWRWWRHGLRRRGGPAAHAQHAGRRPGRVAAPARAGELRDRPVADPPRPAHRPAPRRPRALRRLDRRARAHLQHPAGHLPPVLRERAGAGRRRARRPVAGAEAADGGRDRRHRLARGRVARPHPGLRAVAERGDPRGRGARDRDAVPPGSHRARHRRRGGPGGGGRGFGGGQPPNGAPQGGPPSGAAGGTPPTGAATGDASAGTGGAFRGGGQVSDDMLTFLEANQGSAKYLVAASGSQTTAPIIIETGKHLVSQGELKYVLLGGRGNGTLDAWVTAHGTPVDGFENLYEVTV